MTNYTPGLGCGCAKCREPLPDVAVMPPEEAARRQAEYSKRRVAFQALHGRTMDALGRGGKRA